MKKMQQQSEDVSVLLVDDHLLVRYGMKAMLERLEGFYCAGEASSGREGIEQSIALQPDIVVLDIDLGKGISGFDVAQEIRAALPATRILMLTGNPQPQLFQQGVRLGCDGYVLKVDSDDELVSALQAVAQGRKYISKSFTNDVFHFLQGGGDEVAVEGPTLTPREKSTAYLIQRGLDDAAIGEELGISPKTVRVHKSNIKRKCGCRTTSELILFLQSCELDLRPPSAPRK